ncbi:MAG: sigma-70 factor domain-containing protein, partial [Spirochaetia bacterium]
MSDLQNDPAIVKLIEYAKTKNGISYDEVNDFLPDSVVNSEKIEEVISILAKHNVHLEEVGVVDEEVVETVPEKPTKKKKVVVSDKDNVVDDPIRLYLREIGKEHLLTADQEVELSKSMEQGENIIKDVIRSSGMIIPELFGLAQRAFSKRDPREMNMSKKEISEFLAERR